MTRYLAARAAHALLLLSGISVLSFVFFQLAPGDFFSDLRLNPSISAETVAALRAQYGLDQPLHVKYFRWLTSVAQGEFGYSFSYHSPAAPLLLARAHNTLFLTIPATILAWLLAVPLGTWAAARAGEWPDRVSAAGASALLSVPDLLLALGVLALAVHTGAFPVGGMVSLGYEQLGAWEKVRDILSHAFLPVTALALTILPTLLRHVRAAMVEALAAPFVKASRAHGLPRRSVMRHALRVAANPLISLFGLTLGNLLGASLLIEVILSWPGMGPLLLEAISARDFHVVIGAVMFSAVAFIGGNFAADVLLYAADPRIRTK